MNTQGLTEAAITGIPTLQEQVEFEVNSAIQMNDVRLVWKPENLRLYALLPAMQWGAFRSRLYNKFGPSLSTTLLDRSIRELQVAVAPSRTGNGAYPEEGDWQLQLLRSDAGRMLPLTENIALHLENHSEWAGVLGYNELTAGYEILRQPPEPVTGLPGTELEEHFDVECTRWLERAKLHVKPTAVRQVVDSVARKNAYHPIRNYLDALPPWDGKPRIGTWLIDYCHVASSDSEPNVYAMAVGEKFLISAIARVMDPGCKVDHLLILEGEQGIRKSTLVRTLAGDKWFTDQLDALGGKDAPLQLRGVWIVELPELDVLGRADMSRAKAFLTNQADRFRVPYGRRVVKMPRQCVFMGTTNSGTWLKDETGGRRFWPVRCQGQIDTDGIAAARDQIWAEALLRYRDGVHWWLEDAEVLTAAQREQRERYLDDVWQETVMKAALDLCEAKGSASIHDILRQIGVPTERQDQVAANRVARCLRVAGWEQHRVRFAGKIERRYKEPEQR